MKFQHLGIGQQFIYKDERYVKDGPVMAQHLASGKKTLIPRSAELEPVDGSVTVPPTADDRHIAADSLLDALNAYEHDLLQAMRPHLDDAAQQQLHEALQQGRSRLLRGLGLN